MSDTNERLAPEQIAAIAARANAATAGPWSFDSDYPDEVFGPDGDAVATCYGNLGLDDGYSEEDVAAFIAGARQDIPALLSHVAALSAEVERLRGENEEMRAKLLEWIEARNSLSADCQSLGISSGSDDSAKWGHELAVRCAPLRVFCERLFWGDRKPMRVLEATPELMEKILNAHATRVQAEASAEKEAAAIMHQ